MNDLAFIPRNTKNEVPLNWRPTKMRGKAEFRCNVYQYNLLYKEVRRCSHCCRKQYIKFHKENHVFDIAQKDDKEFDHRVLDRFHNTSYTAFNQRYVKYLGEFCGKVDLSCQKASSEALRTFSLNCIQLGSEITNRLGNTNCDFNKILNPVSDKTIKKAIIDAASSEFEENVKKFQRYKYSALLCDAGTVIKLHCLHFIIARFNDPIDKLLLETFEVEDADSLFYMNCFSQVFQKCDENHLYISAITFDKLPAQSAGFLLYQQTSNNPFVESILKIPCFGHLCNNVFLDLSKKNHDFKIIISDIMSIAHLLRTKPAVNFLNVKCPSISTTRWLYVVDILFFMILHKDDINSYIEINNIATGSIYEQIGEKFEFIYNLLVLLKLFSLIVEKNEFEFYNIIPLTREFFSELDNLYRNTENEIYKNIINLLDLNMRIRLLNNAYFQTIAAYVLSNTGRIEIRKHYIGIRNINNPNFLIMTPALLTISEERKKYETRLQREQTINDIWAEEEEEEEFVDSDMEDINEELDKQIENHELNIDENVEEFDIKTLISDLERSTFEERISEDIYKNIYENAKNELNRLCLLLHIDQSYVESKLDSFLFDDPQVLGFSKYCNEKPNAFWRKVYSFNEDWELFSDLALRYASAFVTETIVERTFSEQEFIQNKRMTNVSTSLMKARLQLHESSKKSKQNKK